MKLKDERTSVLPMLPDWVTTHVGNEFIRLSVNKELEKTDAKCSPWPEHRADACAATQALGFRRALLRGDADVALGYLQEMIGCDIRAANAIGENELANNARAWLDKLTYLLGVKRHA